MNVNQTPLIILQIELETMNYDVRIHSHWPADMLSAFIRLQTMGRASLIIKKIIHEFYQNFHESHTIQSIKKLIHLKMTEFSFPSIKPIVYWCTCRCNRITYAHKIQNNSKIWCSFVLIDRDSQLSMYATMKYTDGQCDNCRIHITSSHSSKYKILNNHENCVRFLFIIGKQYSVHCHYWPESHWIKS